MFLSALLSTCHLLASPMTLSPAAEVICHYHLETPSGRIAFLTEKLAPYAAAAESLNREVTVLASEVQNLSPETDQQKIVDLTQQLTQKMAQLEKMFPVLSMALTVDADLEQIDAILQQTTPITVEQQEALDRIVALCAALSLN